MILQEIGQEYIRKFESELVGGIQSREGFSELSKRIEVFVNQLGVKLLEHVVEQADHALRESAERKRSWHIVRRDTRAVTTRMGTADLTRTYFRHKRSQEYSYLADVELGLPSHERMDEGVVTDLVTNAGSMSYAKSGKANPRAEFTRQTVMKKLRRVGRLTTDYSKIEPRQAHVLYVEADEDHVAHQDGVNRHAKLVYVHEGKQRKGKRTELRNAWYVASTEANAEQLWTEVLNYIEATYSVDDIERIYLAGDGANWIKAGKQYLPKCVPILDEYHRNQYAKKAAGGNRVALNRLMNGLRFADQKETYLALRDCYEEAQTDAHRQRVLDARSYFHGNWEGVVNATKYPDVLGCSAEGHVSHVLSARLSSRPMGWSVNGSEIMSRLRAYMYNNGDIEEAVGRQHKCQSRLNRRLSGVVRRRMESGFERLANIPSLMNEGRTSRTYMVIRAMQHGNWLHR